MFIGRKKELETLGNVYQKDGFQLFIILGHDGAGKTTLVERFCMDKDAIIFTSESVSMRANLHRFSKMILKHYKDEAHQPFSLWSTALEYIKKKQESGGQTNRYKHVIVVLDDFEKLCERDAAFLRTFTSCVNKELANSTIFMIITGSDAHFASRKLLDRLSSKITGRIALTPFKLTDSMIEQIKKQIVKRSAGANAARMFKYFANEIVIGEGEVSTAMFKIISGKALCYLGYGTNDEYVVGSLNDGMSFGEYSLITGHPEMYTVVAFTDMFILIVENDEFMRLINNTNNALEIMRNMAKMTEILKQNIDTLREEASIPSETDEGL